MSDQRLRRAVILGGMILVMVLFATSLAVAVGVRGKDKGHALLRHLSSRDRWENVGGPGFVEEFPSHIGCILISEEPAEPELPEVSDSPVFLP